jgi:hypothetical protein
MSFRANFFAVASAVCIPLFAIGCASDSPASLPVSSPTVIQFHDSSEFDRPRDQSLHDWLEKSCAGIAEQHQPLPSFCREKYDKGARVPRVGANDEDWYNRDPILHGDVVITRPPLGTTDPYFPPQLSAKYCDDLIGKDDETQARCRIQKQLRTPDNTLPAVPLAPQEKRGTPIYLVPPTGDDQPIHCVLPDGSAVRLVLQDCRAKGGLTP